MGQKIIFLNVHGIFSLWKSCVKTSQLQHTRLKVVCRKVVSSADDAMEVCSTVSCSEKTMKMKSWDYTKYLKWPTKWKSCFFYIFHKVLMKTFLTCIDSGLWKGFVHFESAVCVKFELLCWQSRLQKTVQ